MSARTVLAVVLAVPAFVLTPGQAHAAGACQGLPATIEASGGTVTGTEGADVILVTGPATVDALGGDDTICVAGGDLDAGSGNDRVSVTGSGGERAELGFGDDTYVSEGQSDRVDLNAFESEGTDVIDTGSGLGDLVGSGVRGEANHDQVSTLGRVYLYASRGSDVHVSGAHALVLTATDRADYVVSRNRGAVIRKGARVVAFDPLATETLELSGRHAAFVVRGSHWPDHVLVDRARSIRADLGDGSDSLRLPASGPVSGRVEGGRDQDFLTLVAGTSITGDLTQRVLTQHSGGRETRWAVLNFENVVLAAPDIDVRGTAGHDNLSGYGCRVTLDGAGGHDVLIAGDRHRGVPAPRCRRHGVLSGGTGDDVLIGSDGPDVLVGGAGDDIATGGAGLDLCEAEQEQGCER